MGGVRPYLSVEGPETYEVDSAVKGGMIIQAKSNGKVEKAGAGSLLVLGVAETDAKPYANPVSTDADGFETINLSPLPDHVAVGLGRYPVTYAANCGFGVLLKAAANGTVTPWVSGTDDASLIIGKCDEPGGVVVATKAVGHAIIRGN
jgi:hypothetical protein